MKCNLDAGKARALRGIINKDHYCYMYDLDQYYEICTIMDRLEDTVDLLNKFDLPADKNQFNATDFIAWVNYADLIINCIVSLNNLFVKPNNDTLFIDANIPLKPKLKKPYSTKYLGKYYKNDVDDNFFKFIRAMVLAHSLKIDCNKFENFTHKKFAYTPLVRWNTERDKVEITYYIPDFNVKTQTLILDVNDLFGYLESRYNYLDIIFSFIEIEKKKEKNKLKLAFCDAFQNVPTDLSEKVKLLEMVYYQNGDIDAKNNASLLNWYIELFKHLLETEFNSVNNDKISIFKEIMSLCIDDIIENLKLQDEKTWLISEILQHHNYLDDSGKFKSEPYHINKIFEEYEFLSTNEHFFNDHYKKVESGVKNYFSLDDSMSIYEKVSLCIMALGFDNLLHRVGLLEKFPETIIERVREIYEI